MLNVRSTEIEFLEMHIAVRTRLVMNGLKYELIHYFILLVRDITTRISQCFAYFIKNIF